MNTSATIVAFDYGLRRIGVAVGQSIGRTASPVASLQARDGAPDWSKLANLVAEWEPDMLVVGLPMRPDGTPHELAPMIQAFVSRLQRQFRLPVHTIDERLSSHEAQARISTGLDADLDAVAAQVILETWWSTAEQAG